MIFDSEVDKTLIKWLSYTSFIYPLNPLHFLIIPIPVYIALKKRSRVSIEVIYLALASAILYTTGLKLIALITVVIYIVLYPIRFRKHFVVVLGYAALQLIPIYMLFLGIDSFKKFLHRYIADFPSIPSVLYLYIVLLVTIFIMEYLTFIEKITVLPSYLKFISKNYWSIPFILSTALLIRSAIAIVIENNAIANYYAELAYYSFTIGVIAMLVSVIQRAQLLNR